MDDLRYSKGHSCRSRSACWFAPPNTGHSTPHINSGCRCIATTTSSLFILQDSLLGGIVHLFLSFQFPTCPSIVRCCCLPPSPHSKIVDRSPSSAFHSRFRARACRGVRIAPPVAGPPISLPLCVECCCHLSACAAADDALFLPPAPGSGHLSSPVHGFQIANHFQIGKPLLASVRADAAVDTYDD